MVLTCPRCNKMADLKIRKKTEEVVCDECGNVVEISPFTKRAMIDRKDFIVDAKKAFAFECTKCETQVTGVYNKEADRCECSVCGNPLDISQHMLAVLKSRKLTGGDITPNTSVRSLG